MLLVLKVSDRFKLYPIILTVSIMSFNFLRSFNLSIKLDVRSTNRNCSPGDIKFKKKKKNVIILVATKICLGIDAIESF
jgi:hypothetical protein